MSYNPLLWAGSFSLPYNVAKPILNPTVGDGSFCTTHIRWVIGDGWFLTLTYWGMGYYNNDYYIDYIIILLVSVIFDYCAMPIVIVLQPSLWIFYDISFQPTSPKEVPTSTATPLSPPRLHPHHPPRRHRSVRWRRRRSSSCSADGKQPSRKTCSRQSALSQRWFWVNCNELTTSEPWKS